MAIKFDWCGYQWRTDMEGRKLNSKQPWVWYCDDNAFVDGDGILHLTLERNPKEIVHRDGNTYFPEFAGGVARTTVPFGYGTFSCKIKLPKGYNLWPSFWLTGDKNWPPEIDIMEAWSASDDYYNFTVPYFPYIYPSWRTTTNVHYNEIVDSEDSHLDGQYEKTEIGGRNISKCKQRKDPSDEFIEYKCDWFPESIKFYAYGKLVRKVGKEIARKLVENIKDDRFDMDCILNLLCDNPEVYKVLMKTEMLAKDFKYIPYNKIKIDTSL